MKKISMLTVMALVAVASINAQSAMKSTKTAKAPAMIACAVMGSNKVDVAKATKKHMYADYKGRRYFFCCAGCPDAFAKDPAKYAKAPSIALPKSSKGKKAA